MDAPTLKWVCSKCNVPLKPLKQEKGDMITTRGRIITEEYQCPVCWIRWVITRGTSERLHEGIWKTLEDGMDA